MSRYIDAIRLIKHSNSEIPNSSDCISRQSAIEALKGLPTWWADEGGYYGGSQPPMVALLDPEDAVSAIEKLPSAQQWILIKWHEITEEERERESYPKDWVVHIDCEMPCDEQEILVQAKNGYIRWDVCYEDGEFSLDSGWDWIEDIAAWMPLPPKYKGE